MPLDHRIVHVAAREHLGDRMPHQFADAQLPLRAGAPTGLAVVFVFSHQNSLLSSSANADDPALANAKNWTPRLREV